MVRWHCWGERVPLWRAKPFNVGHAAVKKRSLRHWRDTRRARAVYLYGRGLSGREIAEQLSDECGAVINPRTVERDLQTALAASSARNADDIEIERTRDLERVNSLLETWLPILHEPGHVRAKLASDTARWLFARRGRLLGLDVSATGSGTNVAIQVNTNAPAPAVSDKDFSAFTDAEIRAFRYLNDKASGVETGESLESILAASEG